MAWIIPAFLGNVNRDINGSEEIWKFFSRHELPAVMPEPVPGDYNQNGSVDAADYVVWRNGVGTTYTQGDYDVWRAHFGQTAGSGTALPSAEPLSAAVPEPATIMMLAMAIVMFLSRRCAAAVVISIRPGTTSRSLRPPQSPTCSSRGLHSKVRFWTRFELSSVFSILGHCGTVPCNSAAA